MITRSVALRTYGAGAAGAALVVLLMFVWQQVSRWLIWGSGFTDLPGQDTLRLVLNIENYVVVGLIPLLAGRVSGLFSPPRRWVAALLSVSPLLVFFLVTPAPWFLYVLVYLCALGGAYGATWAFHPRP